MCRFLTFRKRIKKLFIQSLFLTLILFFKCYNVTAMESNYLEKLNIIKQFKMPEGDVTHFQSFGEGHIHETYFFVIDSSFEFILQRINNNVFKDVEGLMNNISLVTEFITNKIIEEGGDPTRETLTIIPTLDNKTYYYDKEKDEYYRIYIYISNSVAHQTIENKETFALSGKAFANFALMLNDFDASQLVEVIPNFHNTKARFDHFMQTLKIDRLGLAKNVKDEIDFILKHEKDCSVIVDLIKSGEIPLKVTHNDPKLNNILFNKTDDKPVCVIDLDTIMPGTIIYDFGDAIRSGTNTASESERDLSKVQFNFEYFEAFARSYISTYGKKITNVEKQYLAFGAKLMTLECGIRFLDDYLDGSRYFKIHYPDQNLVRARNQFKLVEEMEKVFDKMNEVIFRR